MPNKPANTAAFGRKTRNFQKIAKELRAKRNPCWICGQPIDYDAPAGTPASFEADHILPRSMYPQMAEDPSNLAASHKRCNNQRSNHAGPPAIGKTSRAW